MQTDTKTDAMGNRGCIVLNDANRVILAERDSPM
jgi:hypothetical protein